MAHVTVHRALSNISTCVCSQEATEEDEPDSGNKRELKKQRSVSECYFVVKGAALILPHDECRHVRRKSTNNGACVIQSHLKSMCYLLREEDTLRMAVKLETAHVGRIRYLVVISHIGLQNTEECCLLGVDCNNQSSIGLVLPVWADTRITLDGDGGFSVSSSTCHRIFKPVSVQAMWSSLQTLHKASAKARSFNYFAGGGTHQWIEYYEKNITSDRSCLNEWHAMDDLVSKRPPSPDAVQTTPTEREATENLIRTKLKEVMMSVDLDEVTSKYIRTCLEEQLGMNFNDYKSFIDLEMLVILGQMDAPTEIFEYLYLGSEWNASNLEELKDKGVNHILNVTREIDNFFPGMFDYLNVRVYDDEATEMLKHWDQTYKYITQVKDRGSKVLVHCKMGISRSASVVVAYVMKACDWNLAQALEFVKHKRNCIKPNSGFIKQLEIYQGILDASKHRNNCLWRSKSETNLKSCENGQDKKEKDSKLDSNKRYTLYLSVSSLNTRPKSWSPSETILDSLFPTCQLKQPLSAGEAVEFEKELKPLRQRSATDPACYLNLEFGCALRQPKPLQNIENLPNLVPTVPRVSSIKDRINELESQSASPMEAQKTPTKIEVKSPMPTSTNKAGLVLNLAHQFEGGSKHSISFPDEEGGGALDLVNSFIQGVEPVVSQTKPPALKHKAVLVKPAQWSQQQSSTCEDVLDTNLMNTESGVSTDDVLAKKPSHVFKDIFSRQSSGANSQTSDPFSWSRQSSCSSSCGVSNSPPVHWYLKDKDIVFSSNLENQQPSEQDFQATQHYTQSTTDNVTNCTESPGETAEDVATKEELLYHKEDIPWTPGTVRRTKQQIEEKNLKRTTSYDSGFPGQSRSTPSTPPELSPESDSAASVVRSHSLRNELRPRSVVLPGRWHPPSQDINCTSPLSKVLQEDVLYLQGIPHSISTPSVVEAVNEVLCGTSLVLNSAMQSMPTSHYSDEYTPDETTENPEVVRQDGEMIQMSKDTQELACGDNYSKETANLSKDLGHSLVISQFDEENTYGVVKRLTKELEAKTGTVVQKKDKSANPGLESREQEQVRKVQAEKESFLGLCLNLPPSPSLSIRPKGLPSDSHNAKDKHLPSQKARTLSDASENASPQITSARKMSFDMDRLKKPSPQADRSGDSTFTEKNRVKPTMRSTQVANGYERPSNSWTESSSQVSGCGDDVASQSTVAVTAQAGKPPPCAKPYGGLNLPSPQLGSQKKNRKMQQGKSHPLSKLTCKQRHTNPLYNTM